MSREFWAYKGNSGLEITSLPISFNDGTKVYHLVEKSALESANAEIERLKYYETQWQSIAGKANLKHLVASEKSLQLKKESGDGK